MKPLVVIKKHAVGYKVKVYSVDKLYLLDLHLDHYSNSFDEAQEWAFILRNRYNKHYETK